MNNFLFYLSLFTVIMSITDFSINKFYKKVWHKKSSKDKFLLIFYLFLHNALYFCIYITLLFTIYYYKTIKIKYLFYYLALLIMVPLHWLTNNNQCYFTVQQNKLLEISDDYGFRDPYLIFTNTHASGAGDMTPRDKFYYGYLISASIITASMIVFKYYKIKII